MTSPPSPAERDGRGDRPASSIVTTGRAIGNPQPLSEIAAKLERARSADAKTTVPKSGHRSGLAAAGLDLGPESAAIDTTDLGGTSIELDDSGCSPS